MSLSKSDMVNIMNKRVEVFYTIKENLIVTVPVYVFYGKWEV
jgi:hypothetical protein